MYKIFKEDKHGTWFKNKESEVVLIERKIQNYTEDFMTLYLINEGLTRLESKSISSIFKNSRSIN